MIRIDLPAEIETRLRQSLGDLAYAAKETLLVEAFRRGQITHAELGSALGLDRFEANALLKRYNCYEGGLTHDELDADVETLNRILDARD